MSVFGSILRAIVQTCLLQIIKESQRLYVFVVGFIMLILSVFAT